jgi:hypothetical protein
MLAAISPRIARHGDVGRQAQYGRAWLEQPERRDAAIE